MRRRIKDGTLHGFKQPTTQGYEWRVMVPDHVPVQPDDQLINTVDQVLNTGDQALDVDETADQPIDDHVINELQAVDDHVIVTSDQALVHLVQQLHRENVQFAGQIGFYQARIQDLEEQVKLLTDAQHQQEQPAEQPPPKRLPWWRRLFAEI